jgi:hypothetical protein
MTRIRRSAASRTVAKGTDIHLGHGSGMRTYIPWAMHGEAKALPLRKYGLLTEANSETANRPLAAFGNRLSRFCAVEDRGYTACDILGKTGRSRERKKRRDWRLRDGSLGYPGGLRSEKGFQGFARSPKEGAARPLPSPKDPGSVKNPSKTAPPRCLQGDVPQDKLSAT